MTSTIRVLSLGAGVQSSTLALMLKHGEITPSPDCAIFADTQAEPPKVYEWLDWLEKQLPFPVYRVTAGNLETASLRVHKSASGSLYTKHSIPAFMRDDAGRTGLMMRQCTADYKLLPIQRKIRSLVGRKRDAKATVLIGISLDEIGRVKPSRVSWIQNEWPLIEHRIRRSDCLAWMQKHGYPKPPRSACYFCPFHNNAEWKKLKDGSPELFERAIKYEEAYQKTMSDVGHMRSVPYLHGSCKPLDSVDFSNNRQPDLFTNECEGMCGV